MVFFKEREKRLLNVKIEDILPSEKQPRCNFDEYELYKLSESIRHNGIIQPLAVRRTHNGYLLIAGERRLKAAKKAGLKRVPCVVYRVGEETAAAFSVIENLQRADLNVFEQAEGINRLITEFGISQSDAAERLGMALSTLSNKLRVLRLSKEERGRIITARLTERHARALIRITDDALRNEALDRIIAEAMTAKECEEYVEKLLNPPAEPVPHEPVRKAGIADVRIFANSLNRLIDTMVAAGIKASRKKQEGKDYIEYRIRIEKQSNGGTEPTDSPQLKIC